MSRVDGRRHAPANPRRLPPGAGPENRGRLRPPRLRGRSREARWPTGAKSSRRSKTWPGMIRSFDYAVHAAVRSPLDDGPWAALWLAEVRSTFVAAYRAALGATNILPEGDGFDVLLRAFVIDTAFRELAHELERRPAGQGFRSPACSSWPDLDQQSGNDDPVEADPRADARVDWRRRRSPIRSWPTSRSTTASARSSRCSPTSLRGSGRGWATRRRSSSPRSRRRSSNGRGRQQHHRDPGRRNRRAR